MMKRPMETKSGIGVGQTLTATMQVWTIIYDKTDFPHHIHQKLLSYGDDVCLFRDRADRTTTRALHSHRGSLSFSLITRSP